MLEPPERCLRDQQEIATSLAYELELLDRLNTASGVVTGIAIIYVKREMPRPASAEIEQFVVTFADDDQCRVVRHMRLNYITKFCLKLLVAKLVF